MSNFLEKYEPIKHTDNGCILGSIEAKDWHKKEIDTRSEIPLIELISTDKADKFCKRVHFVGDNILDEELRSILMTFIISNNYGITSKDLKQVIDKIWSLDFENFKTGKAGIVIDEEDFYASY